MQLRKQVEHVIGQLLEAVARLRDEEYSNPSASVSGATIGQHVRHVVELFVCLQEGYETGLVDYENRRRDRRIEEDRKFAEKSLQNVMDGFRSEDRQLVLKTGEFDELFNEMMINTNYYREILYNVEHAIHHMALIRVAVNEVSDIELPDTFGVAYSTIKYRKECAR